MQARLFREFLANHCAVGIDVTHMLYASYYGDGSNHPDSRNIEARQNKMRGLNPGIAGNDAGVHQGSRGNPGFSDEQCQNIPGDKGDDDGRHFYHPFSHTGEKNSQQADNAGKNPGPNIGGHIIAFPENSQRSAVRPILSLNIADCGRGKVQADQRDAHAAYNWREQVVDQAFSKYFNN